MYRYSNKASNLILLFLLSFYGILLNSCSEDLFGNLSSSEDVFVSNVSVENENYNYAVVRWDEPSDTSSVSKYVVYFTRVDDSAVEIIRYANVGAQELMESLPLGEYGVKVAVLTTDGEQSPPVSAPGTIVIASNVVLPDPPTFTNAATGIDAVSIMLSWSAPENTGKDRNGNTAEIETYTVYWSTEQAVGSGSRKTLGAIDTSVILNSQDGLQQASKYYFAVSATNSGGVESKKSEIISVDTYTPPVQSLTAMHGGNGLALVQWEEPASTYNIDRYVISFIPTDITKDTIIRSNDVGSNTGSLKLPGGIYVVEMYSVSTSETKSIVVQFENQLSIDSTAVAPSAPQINTISSDTNEVSITLSWYAPDSPGVNDFGEDANIIGYTVYWSTDSEVNTGSANKRAIAGTTTTLTLTENDNLGYGITYYFIVTATSDVPLEGSPSSITLETTASNALPPSAVGSIIKVGGNLNPGELSISWTDAIPGKESDGITNAQTVYRIYYAESLPGNTVASVVNANEVFLNGISNTEATIIGLQEYTEYDIVLRAINAGNSMLFTDSEITTLLSNGVQSLTIAQAASTAVFGDPDIILDVSYIYESVNNELTWESSLESVAQVSSGVISIVGVGSTTIQVTSQANSSKSDSFTLSVEPKPLSSYTLEYSDVGDLEEGSAFAIGPIQKVPSGSAIYAVVDAITGSSDLPYISINPDNGSISLLSTAPAGTYSLLITATANSVNYTGSTSGELIISIVARGIAYKPDMSGVSRNYFSIGDIDNQFLFIEYGVSDTSGLTADIEITNVDTQQVVYSITELSPSITSSPNGTGVGFGPSMPYAQFTAIPDRASLQITLNTFANGVPSSSGIATVTKSPRTDIYSWRDLQAMKHATNANYIVQNSFSFPNPGDYGFPTSGFVTIAPDTSTSPGYQGSFFTGTLNGNNSTISNFWIDRSTQKFSGIFGAIMGTSSTTKVVYSLNFSRVNIISGAVSGTITGYLADGVIDNVHITRGTGSGMSVYGTEVINDFAGSYAGGIVGFSESTKITGSSEMHIYGSDKKVGGLVGQTTGAVIGYSTGNINGSSEVGGLVGYSGSSTVGYSRGSIIASASYGIAGGLVGYGKESIIGFSTGRATGTEAGGLVGFVTANPPGNIVGYSTAIVIDSDKSTTANYLGGLVGNHPSATVTGYALGYVSSVDGGPAIGAGNVSNTIAGRTAAEIGAEASVAGSGDHVGSISVTTKPLVIGQTPGMVVEEATSGSTGSRNITNFTAKNFSFGSTLGQWIAASSSSAHSWPILVFPADFPGGTPVQYPVIPPRPENFQE